MGGCRARKEGSSCVCGVRSKAPDVEDRSTVTVRRCMRAAGWSVSNPQRVRTCGRRWKDLGPFSQRDRQREHLHRIPSSRLLRGTVLGLLSMSPIFTRVCVPFPWHQLPSTPHSGTCIAAFRRQKGTFSIPDGQLTSALSPKLHFPQILSAKHPCLAARFPQSAPESSRSPGHHPWTNRSAPQSRARRLEHPCSADSCLCHTPTAQRLLQGVVFLSLSQFQDGIQNY